jgi:hypothetical protein
VKTLKSSLPLKLFLGLTLLGSLTVIILAFLFLDFFRADAWGPYGPYQIEEVVLTSELDQVGQPVSSSTKFTPSQTITCWVATRGAEGLIGMRWYYQDQLIYNGYGETHQNQISTYIRSTPPQLLPKGQYRVEIYTVEKPHESVYFTIE